MMPFQIQTLGQQRAAHAWQQVESVFNAGNGFDEFQENAKKLPMRIRASGLGQSFAFLSAKKKAQSLRTAIASWCQQRGMLTDTTEESVSRKFRECSASEMRLLTAEVLAYLEWVVRFSDARKKD